MALKRGTEESGSQVPSILNRMESTEAPPTYHKVNKFTRGFQNIVDSYGIATYREINPGVSPSYRDNSSLFSPVHDDQLPVPVRRHVRRHGPRADHAHLGHLLHRQRETARGCPYQGRGPSSPVTLVTSLLLYRSSKPSSVVAT